jgi:hypothetical protein
MHAARIASCLCAVLVLAGCANAVHVQAWEKGNLARPDMRFDGDALDARFTQHVYTSKEAASGGASVGGGGCGCN